MPGVQRSQALKVRGTCCFFQKLLITHRWRGKKMQGVGFFSRWVRGWNTGRSVWMIYRSQYTSETPSLYTFPCQIGKGRGLRPKLTSWHSHPLHAGQLCGGEGFKPLSVALFFPFLTKLFVSHTGISASIFILLTRLRPSECTKTQKMLHTCSNW